jgi:hypothetical protein
MNENHWHEWVAKAFQELGDNYEYKKFRALIRQYDKVDHMKKFLKVGEYEEPK